MTPFSVKKQLFLLAFALVLPLSALAQNNQNVLHVRNTTAGKMQELYPQDKWDAARTLVISGPLNGTDIAFLVGALLPVEGLLQIAHVLIDVGFLRTFVLLVDQLVGALQGQVPLLAVLGQVDIDQLTKQSALSTVLRYQLGTLLVGLLEPQAVALVVTCQTFVTPCRNHVHGNDAWLFEGHAGIFLQFFVVLTLESHLAKSQVAGRCTLVGQVFGLQLQCFIEALLGKSLIARLLTDGAQREGGKVHTDVAAVILGMTIDSMRHLDTLLTVYVLEHIDRLVAAGAVVGLLIVGKLGGVLQPFDAVKELVGLSRTIVTIHFVGKLLKLVGQLLLSPALCSS